MATRNSFFCVSPGRTSAAALTFAALVALVGLAGCGGAEPPAPAPPPAPSFCADDFEWAGWRALLARNPADEDVVTMYALRLGLCDMIADGKIEPQRGRNLFDRAQQAVLGRMLME